MAYTNNGSSQQRTYGNKAPVAASTPAASGAGSKSKNRVFSAFKNKSGNGYSTQITEEVTIPAGTRLGLFLDEVTSKKTGQTYEVINVSIMPERKQA